MEFGILEVLIFFRVSFFLKLYIGPENNKLSGKAKRRKEGNKNSQESLLNFSSPGC